ncbi:L-threonine 3-dehydrogenase (TDH) [Durusdinium trenchii]|uniref:L-threonine 3-dehydrogenase (TDH) n=1 Tax=Durusdinium trenchii TaxID=1381693 RepID=A0ABP0NJ56_9DINO
MLRGTCKDQIDPVWCADAVQAVRDASPQTLIVGCSILDLIDVEALAQALRTYQAGALLYFPIHYSGTTAFEGSAASVAEPLSRCYDESLETRGQLRDVTALYASLGVSLLQGCSDWQLKGDDPLLKQLISFMAVNALGFQPWQEVAEAVVALKAPSSAALRPEVQLHVTNVDYLGRVPRGASRGAAEERREALHPRARGAPRAVAVEFVAPGGPARCVEGPVELQEGEVLVEARLSAISAGTERRMLLHGPGDEPLDATLSMGESTWPMRYGYCLVGSTVEDTGRRRVFAFAPHASHVAVKEDALQLIPEDITDEGAVFFANMETACSLCQDAAPVLGERVALWGAGTVGALTAAVLLRGGFDVTIFDPQLERVEALRQRFPQLCGVTAGAGSPEHGAFDVALELSGSGEALAQAVQMTRRGGKVVIGSLYSKEVLLPLDLRFHRSEMTLVASQVSRVSGALSTRWSKQRRAELAWEMLRELHPEAWIPSRKTSVLEAPEVYRSLLKPSPSSPAQWIFTYDDLRSCAPAST